MEGGTKLDVFGRTLPEKSPSKQWQGTISQTANSPGKMFFEQNKIISLKYQSAKAIPKSSHSNCQTELLLLLPSSSVVRHPTLSLSLSPHFTIINPPPRVPLSIYQTITQQLFWRPQTNVTQAVFFPFVDMWVQWTDAFKQFSSLPGFLHLIFCLRRMSAGILCVEKGIIQEFPPTLQLFYRCPYAGHLAFSWAIRGLWRCSFSSDILCNLSCQSSVFLSGNCMFIFLPLLQ